MRSWQESRDVMQMTSYTLIPDNRQHRPPCGFTGTCPLPGRFAVRALSLDEEALMVCSQHLPRAIAQQTQIWGALIIQCNDHVDS